MEDRTTGTFFHLTDELAPLWESIGRKLGIEETVLGSIKNSNPYDAERLGKVWDEWLDHPEEFPTKKKYPPSREGLRSLLDASKNNDIACEYFEFLDRLH